MVTDEQLKTMLKYNVQRSLDIQEKYCTASCSYNQLCSSPQEEWLSWGKSTPTAVSSYRHLPYCVQQQSNQSLLTMGKTWRQTTCLYMRVYPEASNVHKDTLSVVHLQSSRNTGAFSPHPLQLDTGHAGHTPSLSLLQLHQSVSCYVGTVRAHSITL